MTSNTPAEHGESNEPQGEVGRAEGYEDYQEGSFHYGRPRRRFSIVRVAVASAVAAGLVLGSFRISLPLLTIEPGPVRKAAPLVKIENTETYSSQGTFLVTTVSLYEATLANAIRGWLRPDITVVERSRIFPPGTTREEVTRETAAQMDDSQLNATVAALRFLGYELPSDGALVRKVLAKMPAENVLDAGDVVVAVDGKPVATPKEATEAISSHKPKEKVRLTVRRGQETKEFELVTARGPSGQAVVGVEIVQNLQLPFNVEIDAGEIGGPSAGLTFALTIVDLLTPEDLTHGKTIADTGTIDADGKVGSIGGVTQKIAAAKLEGARIFLVPRSQVREARRAADGDLEVIGVSTLADAVAALRRLV